MNACFPVHRLTGVILESIIRINGNIYIQKGTGAITQLKIACFYGTIKATGGEANDFTAGSHQYN